MATTPRRIVRLGAAAGLAATLVLAGCGSDSEKAEQSTTTTSAPPSTTTTAAAGGGGSTNGGSTNGGSTNGDSSNGGSSGGSSSGPVIEEYAVPPSVDCSTDNPELTLSWSVRDAERVTLSIDGPGVYDEYGATDQATVVFPCPGPHTYLITAYGPGGATTTRTVTVTGKNVPTTTQAGDQTESNGSGGPTTSQDPNGN